MKNDSNKPDPIGRRKANIEDDVRSFLLTRLPGNRIPKVNFDKLGLDAADVRALQKPSYIHVYSGCDETPPDEECLIGAEGVMVHREEDTVHLAFKCGDPAHQIHYTSFFPDTVVQMALAVETAWPGRLTEALDQMEEQRSADDIDDRDDPEDDIDDLIV